VGLGDNTLSSGSRLPIISMSQRVALQHNITLQKKQP